MDFSTTQSNIENHYIFKVKYETKEFVKPNIMNVLLIDNSGSMGSATKQCTMSIGKGMFELPENAVNVIPGAIMLFDDKVTFLSKTIKSPKDIIYNFPPQGSTNITLAIKASIEYILEHCAKNKNIHYILTFLSDGGHNYGDNLTATDIQNMRKIIDKHDVKLSIIVVGISSNDTRLGMMIKTGLETITLSKLNSVYYASSTSEMNSVIEDLTSGCMTSLCSGKTVSISVKNGKFLENMLDKIDTFLYNDETVILVESNGQNVPELIINNISIIPEITHVKSSDISLIMNSVIPKLSQIRVAYGVDKINAQITLLNNMIDKAEKLFETVASKHFAVGDIGKIQMTPLERLTMIKQLKRSTNMFCEERNKLKLLKASVENNSAKQAEYLDGFTKKYSAKAVLKSNTVNVSCQEVLKQLKDNKDTLLEALNKDKQLLQNNAEYECSFLSLNNAFEQLNEWVNAIETATEGDFPDIYSLLVCFGFSAYPVQFEKNNAVQMDPFQTNCKYIETTLIDTSSLMLSNQLEHTVMSPSRQEITDGLILVNPLCPETSVFLMKNTAIYQYICSVILCRDLYMYHPKMTFSMHSHSLVKTIDEYYANNNSTVYLELGLKTLYSIRKYWGDYCMVSPNVDLFKRWFCDLETITQSEKDGCNHPVQLLLLLGSLDLKQLNIDVDTIDVNTAFVNIMNEFLARLLKIKLINLSGNTQDTKNLAISLLQKLYQITKENSPKPNSDIMVQEPTLVSIRETCQHWAEISNETNSSSYNVLQKFNTTSMKEFVNDSLKKYLYTFNFALSVQNYIKEHNTSWDEIINAIEHDKKLPDKILNYMSRKMKNVSKTVYNYLGIVDEQKVEKLAETMFAQSLLCHDSQSRSGINLKSVLDNITLQEIIIDLRMAFYFDACKVKREQWLKIIGDATYEGALNADVNVYEKMIGTHTHGLCSKQFWALLHAAKDDEQKLQVFITPFSVKNGTLYYSIFITFSYIHLLVKINI